MIPRRKLMEKRRGKKDKSDTHPVSGIRLHKCRYDGGNIPPAESDARQREILMADMEPAEVPMEEMRPILCLTGASEIIGYSRGIKVGTRVKIIGGPLKDLEGRIIDVDTRKARAKVSLDILNQTKRVDLGLVVLQAMDKAANS